MSLTKADEQGLVGQDEINEDDDLPDQDRDLVHTTMGADRPTGSHLTSTKPRGASFATANPPPTAHLDNHNQYFTASTAFASPSRSYIAPLGEEETIFSPNSLVIVSAAALLESIVSSKRDTSSPELLNKVIPDP